MHKSIEETIIDISKALKAGVDAGILWALLVGEGQHAARATLMIRWARERNKVITESKPTKK